MRFILLPVLFLIPFCIRAQNGATTRGDGLERYTGTDDSLRSQNIQRFPDYFFLYPVLKQRSLNFELAKTDRSALLTYKPNNTYSLGLGAYLFEVGLELGFAIPLGERSIQKYGESEARDIILNLLAKRWGVDAFYQRYSGFYLVDRDHARRPDEPFPQRGDIATRNFGATGHYVFNNRRFSFRSAYNFSERQLKSNGSFLLFASISTFRVAADSSIINDDSKTAFGPDVDFTKLRYTTFSVAPGYTYSLTYHDFFLNTTLALGPAHHWINYDLERNSSTHYDIAINSFLYARVAVGYNGDRIFGGIGFVSQGSRLKFNDVTFADNNSVFKMLVGYRFREVGILKKRFWDLLPLNL